MGKMGNLSQIVPFFSDFSPVSYQLHIFFYTPHNISLAISHTSPFPPLSPPLSPLRLRPTPMPGNGVARTVPPPRPTHCFIPIPPRLAGRYH